LRRARHWQNIKAAMTTPAGIHELRVEGGISVAELARELNLDQAGVWRTERRAPSQLRPTTVERYRAALRAIANRRAEQMRKLVELAS
jgi:DNA-binding transcriptional regulator YiaG